MDRTKAILGQYEIVPDKVRKGRGVILLETKEGLYQLKEYVGPKERIAVQYTLTEQLAQKHEGLIEQIIPNKEGDLFTTNYDKRVYLLQKTIEGKECDPTNRAECIRAVKQLKKIHKDMYLEAEGLETRNHIRYEVEKRCKDMLRIRNYLRKRNHKTEFELELCRIFDRFYGQAQLAKDLSLNENIFQFEEKEGKNGCICQGDCQYHNMIWKQDKIGFIGFEKWTYDTHIRDFYRFFRKIMEKNQWNLELGEELMEHYASSKDISEEEARLLLIRFIFPEKIWKILNYYMNTRKSYLSERNIEKCKTQIQMERDRGIFIKKMMIDICETKEYEQYKSYIEE